MIDLTRILSDRPGTPARSELIPRTTNCTSTPA